MPARGSRSDHSSGGGRSGGSRSGASRSGGSGGGRTARGGVGTPRPYQRTVRVNESMREVIADTLEAIDDDRLGMVTITGVDVDPDFKHGVVYYSALFTDSPAADVAEAFDEHRVRLQGAVGSQVRLKRTPLLTFRPDPAVTEGQKMDDIIRALPPVSEETTASPADPQSDES